MNRVTSADVARLAGVSQSAVSRVFTPGASFSKETEARVRAAAEALGYRPNPLARGLITGRTRLVGIVAPGLSDPCHAAAAEAVARALRAEGLHALLCLAGGAGEDLTQAVATLIDYQADGIVTLSLALPPALAERCAGAGMRIVAFGAEAAAGGSVAVDGHAGGALAARFLLAGGHRRLVLLAARADAAGAGFGAAVAAAGRPLWAAIETGDGRDAAIEAARRLFGAQRRPDAVFAGSDALAMAVIDVLHLEFGLRAGQDVSVVGTGDAPGAGGAPYGLTTLRPPLDAMAAATAAALSTAGVEPPQLRLPGALILRTSARIPPDWPG